MRKYDRLSIDYQVNILALEEMESIVPMTTRERNSLRKWVRKGHELESNPWDYTDGEGYLLNYLQAFRLKYGYSSGPWDYWKGPATQLLWDNDDKCFRCPDEIW